MHDQEDEWRTNICRNIKSEYAYASPTSTNKVFRAARKGETTKCYFQ